MIPKAKRMDVAGEYVHATLAKALLDVEKRTGRKVLNFGPGSPDVPPSNIYQEKLKELIVAEDAHKYPAYGAIPELTKALISWYKTRFTVDITSEELLPLLGAKDGISHMPLAFLDAGDEVLVPNPGYPAFDVPAKLVGAIPVFYPLSEQHDFKIDFSSLEKLITPRTKIIWVNFPSNPTGAVVTKEELTEIVTFAKNHNLFIIYDNAYAEISFDDFVPPSILEIEGAKDIAIEIGSFSKMFSFAGFRMGWVVGNKEAINTLATLKSQMDSGMSLPLQRLGAFGLTHPDTIWQKEMINSYRTRRDSIASYVTKLGLSFSLPKAGLYIWAKIPDSEKDAVSFCQRLLEEKQILFTPGSAFGNMGDRYVRISICINIDSIDKYFNEQ